MTRGVIIGALGWVLLGCLTVLFMAYSRDLDRRIAAAEAELTPLVADCRTLEAKPEFRAVENLKSKLEQRQEAHQARLLRQHQAGLQHLLWQALATVSLRGLELDSPGFYLECPDAPRVAARLRKLPITKKVESDAGRLTALWR